jgi:hypothetical protein
MKFSKIKLLWLVPILILIIGVSACGGDDDEDTSLSGASTSAQEVDNSNTSTDTDATTDEGDVDSVIGSIPEPEPDILVLPEIPEFDGRLLFTSGNNIYLGEFNGQEAQLLVADTTAPAVIPDPDSEGFIHKSSGLRRPRIMWTDFAGGESLELISLTGTFRQLSANVIGWSPDREWLLLQEVNGPPRWHIMSHDGSTNYRFEDSVIPIWLEDNTVLQIEVDFSFGPAGFADFDGLPILTTGFSRYIPQTGEIEDLPLSTAEVSSPWDYNLLDLVLRENGLALAHEPYTDTLGNTVEGNDGSRWSVVLPNASRGFAPENCNVWGIERLGADGNNEIVYEVDDTVIVARLQVLDDGSALFTEWQLEDCNINGDLHVALKRITPDGSVTEITSDIAPVVEGRNSLTLLVFLMANRYDVSPDQQYVVWAGGTFDSRTATLNLTHLESGATATLMTTTAADSTTFLDEKMFRTVYWLP